MPSAQPVLLLLLLPLAASKVYTRCELAKELRDVHEVPEDQLATWICILKHESNLNTSAVNPGSGDHGLFQISHLYWCSPVGHACGVECSALRDDDIEDDVVCARRIFRQHQRISGDGFNAWAVYRYYCKGDVGRYIEGCFDGAARNKVDTKSLGVYYKTTSTAAPQKDYFDGTGTARNKVLSTPVNVKSDGVYYKAVSTAAPAFSNRKSEKDIIYRSAKSNYAFNWKANGFRLIKMETAAGGFV